MNKDDWEKELKQLENFIQIGENTIEVQKLWAEAVREKIKQCT